MHIYALRLQPNTDLRIELERLCKKQSHLHTTVTAVCRGPQDPAEIPPRFQSEVGLTR